VKIIPGVQCIEEDVADVTTHGVVPIKTWLLLILVVSNPEPINLIDEGSLVSIVLTEGVKVVDHWKLQFAEHFDGIPFIFTENWIDSIIVF
jgi:hypothetical protein